MIEERAGPEVNNCVHEMVKTSDVTYQIAANSDRAITLPAAADAALHQRSASLNDCSGTVHSQHQIAVGDIRDQLDEDDKNSKTDKDATDGRYDPMDALILASPAKPEDADREGSSAYSS